MSDITIVGAGLAGSEAAWQLAKRDCKVSLYEMRPKIKTAVHQSGDFAELVCSNSLRSADLNNAVGLLKEELRHHHSIVLEAADATRIPAGGALAVDRIKFQTYITDALMSSKNINIFRSEVTTIPTDKMVIVASGPLTSASLFDHIKDFTTSDDLYFYDAAAPIVTAESVDLLSAFWQSRYDKGVSQDYLNCPLTKDEYHSFYDELLSAEWNEVQECDREIFFEGCMPIETMAKRGYDTLRFGPFKPKGLIDPRTGKMPYAVLQLRYDDAEKQLLNLVGCQTRMKWGDQKKVFQKIPALKKAEFVRYGVMHRNTYINSPRLLAESNQLLCNDKIFFAGQITGVEGYVESTASGCIAGINAARMIKGNSPLIWPRETAMGSLIHYICNANPDGFQPMNINFGLFPPLSTTGNVGKKERARKRVDNALQTLGAFLETNHV